MTKRRNIAPWGIPILAAAALAACVAAPAYADGIPPFGVATVSHIDDTRVPQCYPSLSAAAQRLNEAFGETPLVGVFKGGTKDQPKWVVSIFANIETGSWTVTQSDNNGTCAVTAISPGHGGIIFDMEGLVENSRLRNIGTGS